MDISVDNAPPRHRAPSSGDPFPDHVGHQADRSWFYLPGEMAAGLIDRLVREGAAANNHVDYAENFRRPYSEMRLRCAPGTPAFRVCTVPDGVLEAVGGTIAQDPDGWSAVTGTGQGPVEIIAKAPSGAVAIAVEPTDLDRFTVSSDGTAWNRPDVRPGGAVPPHAAGEPVLNVVPRLTRSGLFEFDAPVLGRPVIKASSVNSIGIGESVPEAIDEEHPENRVEIHRRDDGLWTTRHEVAGRFLRVSATDLEEVSFDARIHPVSARGSFACSDDTLTRIWNAGALTLRLCMQGLVLDGIKRDRMPWAGDQALNTLANAFSFGDSQIVRDGLLALGSPTGGFVNGIVDYSLWWLINARYLALYLGDDTFSTGFAEHVHRFVEDLAGLTSESGVLQPRRRAEDAWVFIDWGYKLDPGFDSTALQMLWYWALRSAQALLEKAGHSGSSRCGTLAEKVHAAIAEQSWDPDAGRWRNYLDKANGPASSYPNFLGMLAGIELPHPDGGQVLDTIEEGLANTPFMRALALRALGRAGRSTRAIEIIKAAWAPMLADGSVTLWEEFPSAHGSPYAMYGRPFGKSLCHAWASGPTALLPELVLGLEPVEDGWARFRVSPKLGDLVWATATVPTPRGPIEVSASRRECTVTIPDGATLELDGTSVNGPHTYTLNLG